MDKLYTFLWAAFAVVLVGSLVALVIHDEGRTKDRRIDYQICDDICKPNPGSVYKRSPILTCSCDPTRVLYEVGGK